MLAVIGSIAMRERLLGLGREPKDYDLVGSYDDVMKFAKHCSGEIRQCYPIDDGNKLIIKKSNGLIIEAELTWEGSVAEKLLDLIKKDSGTFFTKEYAIPSIHLLYMLKMSHRYLRNSPHFLKTMQDIKKLRSAGATLQLEHLEFFDLREKETYNYKHPKLNVSKKDFFKGDGVEYVYDHDTIHQSVKHLREPAYMFFKPDQNEVFCDRELFFKVPRSWRLYAVLEEAYVLALERSQIPFKDKVSPRKSFEIALMKICTSITSGWFREFAWEHYDEILALYDDNYVDRFWFGVEVGIVKKVAA